MAASTTLTSLPCSMAIVVAFLLAAAASLASAGPVPAVYVLGDSLADVGNNNHLLTLLKADFAHNGMDYPGGKATGRFSNGKNFPDFLAEKLGLATSPPYLALSSSNAANYVNGVNFASGGAGVSNGTNKDQCLSFDKQIDYMASVYASLVQSLGQAQAAAHLSKSLFAITIGSNDIIHYAKSTTASSSSPPTQQFVDALVQTLTGQLQRLYNLGARRLLFLGTGPVGCCPSLRELSASKDCSAVANDASARFNSGAPRRHGGAQPGPALRALRLLRRAAPVHQQPRGVRVRGGQGRVLRPRRHERQDRVHAAELLLRQPDQPRLLGLLPPHRDHRQDAHRHGLRRVRAVHLPHEHQAAQRHIGPLDS